MCLDRAWCLSVGVCSVRRAVLSKFLVSAVFCAATWVSKLISYSSVLVCWGGRRGVVGGFVGVHSANSWVVCVFRRGCWHSLWALKNLINPSAHRRGRIIKGLPN